MPKLASIVAPTGTTGGRVIECSKQSYIQGGSSRLCDFARAASGSPLDCEVPLPRFLDFLLSWSRLHVDCAICWQNGCAFCFEGLVHTMLPEITVCFWLPFHVDAPFLLDESPLGREKQSTPMLPMLTLWPAFEAGLLTTPSRWSWVQSHHKMLCPGLL